VAIVTHVHQRIILLAPNINGLVDVYTRERYMSDICDSHNCMFIISMLTFPTVLLER
jgi:hypothetical protein